MLAAPLPTPQSTSVPTCAPHHIATPHVPPEHIEPELATVNVTTVSVVLVVAYEPEVIAGAVAELSVPPRMMKCRDAISSS